MSFNIISVFLVAVALAMDAFSVSLTKGFTQKNLTSSQKLWYGIFFGFFQFMMPLIGYETDCVYYERKERPAGESKYPLKKMLSFAFDGITSFSVKPISLISTLGVIIIIICIIAAIYSLIAYFIGNTVPGWTSLMLSIWFIGGVQLRVQLCVLFVGGVQLCA